MPKDEELRHFTRDRSLASDIADEFGGGAGNAEDLIQANSLTRTQEFTAAQLLPGESGVPEHQRRRPDLWEDGELTLKKADVAKAAEVDEEDLLAFDVHADYVVFAYRTDDGRTHKDVLAISGKGKLESPYEGDSPARAAVRAKVEARAKVKDAREEADEIVAKAREEAEKILAEAAEKAREEGSEAVQKAAEARRESEEPKHPRQAANQRSSADDKAERRSGGSAQSGKK